MEDQFSPVGLCDMVCGCVEIEAAVLEMIKGVSDGDAF